MASLHRVGSIDIADDQRFTRKSWVLERSGWALLVAVVAGALAGALGPGPLSKAQAASPDGSLRIEYERFGRLRTESEVRIRIPRSELWLDRAYVESVQVERLMPQPLRIIPEGDRLRYEFPGASPCEIVFQLRFRRPGRLAARAGIPGGETVDFGHFVYP